MEVKPAQTADLGRGWRNRKSTDRQPCEIILNMIWFVTHYVTNQNPYKKDRYAKTQRSFCGAPDWIRTSGLPGRSRTLYPTELRTHIYENRPKTGFNYSVISGQIVVRLLRDQGMQCRKMALLCGFSAAPGGVSELSEPNALSKLSYRRTFI